MSEENQKGIGESGLQNQSADLESCGGASLGTQSGENMPDGMFSALATTSAKTLYYLFLTLAVLAVFISQLFPYLAMRFYYDMEDYGTATKYAQTYCQRGGKNRTEALLFGIEMSELLLFESSGKQTQKSAEYLLYFTGEFAALPAAEFDSRCAAMDGFYKDCYRQGMISTEAAAGLFSFKDYVFAKHAAAQSVLGGVDKLLYDGTYPTAEDGFITANELEQMFADILDGHFAPSPQELAVVFGQISQNIDWGNGNLIYDGQLEWATTLYRMMMGVFDTQDGQYSFFGECQKLDDTVEKLYIVGTALSLSECIVAFFDKQGQAEEVQNAQKHFLVSADGQELTLAQYFDRIAAKCK